MPLVRFQVRNEYGLGQPELFKDANKEDPKAVLDGVAVAGLVGILRQLGDLAEYVLLSFSASVLALFNFSWDVHFFCFVWFPFSSRFDLLLVLVMAQIFSSIRRRRKKRS